LDRTYSYTYFCIESNGRIEDNKGLVAFEKGVFNPDDITKVLGIQPFSSWKKGDKRSNGSQHLFSSWDAEKSDIERLDVEAQCMETIKNLKNEIPILKQIKEQYDVNYVLMIVPTIYGEEQPLIRFNEEIIEFCYLTGTIINVDMYINSNDIIQVK
jgi:hypothetical protein